MTTLAATLAEINARRKAALEDPRDGWKTACAMVDHDIPLVLRLVDVAVDWMQHREGCRYEITECNCGLERAIQAALAARKDGVDVHD